MANELPEGTDHIVPGATATGAADETAEAPRAATTGFREKVTAQGSEFATQATDKAREYAAQGKDRASGALDEVARLLTDNAAQIDERVGAQYGDYARRAAESVTSAAEALRGKDIDELLEDFRTIVRQSPALAVGAAATLGFFAARVMKSGSESLAETARTLDTRDTSGASATKTTKSKD